MADQVLTLGYYAVPLLLVYGLYMRKHVARESSNRGIFQEAVETGMTTPPSLHPVIDVNACIGCESCVHACPEYPNHKVLGLIGRKANLVSPTDCIGHGACKTACPVNAISLVFGTSERGVDIPNVSPTFETNVPGIFVAGELGGMGLIRNAVEQGRQALDNLVEKTKNLPGSRDADCLDVAIIGAGPAGFSATLAAHEKGMRYVTIEQNSLGGTVANFPRGKLVMTAPVELPMYGQMKFRETRKEELMDFWQGVAAETGIRINYSEKLEAVSQQSGKFELVTNQKSYIANSILLALGRRGSPRKLDVPGEDLPKVVYTMIDPAEYAGQHVCVVGGGDSALEAANAIAEEAGTTVTLSYRSDAFSRAKRKNRDHVDRLVNEGKLRVIMNSDVTHIHPDRIEMKIREGDTVTEEQIANDSIIVCVGGILPTSFLKEIGISVETKYGTA